jgi:ribosomal protein S12 methylthiotransferase
VDLSGEFELPRLLEALHEVEGLEWIRILYVYPSFVTGEMIDAIARLPKVLKYIDIPLQHIADKMLRRMGRRANEAKTRTLLESLRSRIPGLYLRTTFIVGFPGEDQEDFATLRDFVREFAFERLGVFTYSEEEGTPAAVFAEQVAPAVRKERLEEIMLVQQENAFRHNRARVGSTATVLVDGPSRRRGGLWEARSHGEAPEIDPVILVAGGAAAVTGTPGAPARFRELPVASGPGGGPRPRTLRTGEFLEVRITGTEDYDLLASPA